jgi:hypothetical protein
MFAQMRTDIRPLCDKHFRPMNAVYLIWTVPGMPDANCTPAFKCEGEGCDRLYDIIRGYHERPGGQLQRSIKQVSCPKDALPMFIARHDSQGSIKQ